MTAIASLTDPSRVTIPPFGAPVQPLAASMQVWPAASQFAATVELIKSVFQVPAVSILLNGAPDAASGDASGQGVWRSFLEVPLLKDGEAIGALRLLDSLERGFAARERHILADFARLIVEQIDLWTRATRDALTGAQTRRAFEENLRAAFAACQRRRGRAALISFDLDHFKRVNDTLGHAAGDAVLQAAGRAVHRELRAEDQFGRVGGEEFAVLVQGADVATGLEVAERIRKAIAAMVVPGHGGLRVSASFGVVSMTAAAPSPEALTEAADAALYAAKDAGRNCVVAGKLRPVAVM